VHHSRSVATGAVGIGLLTAAAIGQGFQGFAPPPQTANCIPARQAAEVQKRVEAYLARRGPHPAPDGPSLYRFFPAGGTLYSDLTTGNFVDLDPSSAVLNYLCANYGNDGHQGCDAGAPTWQEMAIGIPVFAVLGGTVVDVHDGDPDMNTSCEAGGNYVIIDHGGDHQTWYFHFKRNSVAVTVGQLVRAGAFLGSIGSSGCSFGPHLHFQSMRSGVPYEAFAGPCRAGPSGWAPQIDPPASVYLRDFGVTSQDLGLALPAPERFPTSPQIAFADPLVYYWAELCNLPANSTWTERYRRPDGTVEFDLGPFPFGNPTTFGWSRYWFGRNIGGMHSIPGTWRIQFSVNGVQVIDAPVEVVATVNQGFNRPPLPVAAAFDPPSPQPADVLFARITGPHGIRDLDWDLVRYRYRWTLNGTVVRDTISAGLADAIPEGLAANGDIVECTITPGDGHVEGTPAILRTQIGCYANCDGTTIPPILNVSDFICFQTRYAAGNPYANCDGSTIPPILNVSDFVCYLTKYAAGCS